MAEKKRQSFWAKIAGVQNENPTIEKKGYNKHLDYHYALIDDVLRVYKPLLTKHGLVLYNMLDSLTGILKTVLQDTEGEESLNTTYNVNLSTTDQKIGASLTYGRRYNAGILLNIATDEDIDGPQEIKNVNNNSKYPTKKKVKVVTKQEREAIEKARIKKQEDNFTKYYNILKGCGNLDELHKNFKAFLQVLKTEGSFTEDAKNEIISMKDDMKNSLTAKEEEILDDDVAKAQATVKISAKK